MTCRPEYRTSNGTPLKRTDSATASRRPPPFGWDTSIFGEWPTRDVVDAAPTAKKPKDDAKLRETLRKLDTLIDRLEAQASEKARARLRSLFGLDEERDEERDEGSLHQRIFGK